MFGNLGMVEIIAITGVVLIWGKPVVKKLFTLVAETKTDVNKWVNETETKQG